MKLHEEGKKRTLIDAVLLELSDEDLLAARDILIDDKSKVSAKGIRLFIR